MAAFTYTFDPSKPLGTDLANTLDTVIQNLAQSIKERYQLEHYSFDSATAGATEATNAIAQGRHKPGYVSVVYVGTSVQIAALTGMQAGALAYDTTLGALLVYDGASWSTYPISGSSPTSILAFSAYRNTTQNIAKSTWTKIQMNNEDFDYGSHYDKDTNYRYTPGTLGLYHFCCFAEVNANVAVDLGLYKNGVIVHESAEQAITASYSKILAVTNAADYFELFIETDVAATLTMAYFSAYLIARS